jgi:uncharacterized protein (TIGR02231 family)
VLALLLPLVCGDPTVVASHIQEVTLYGTTALVRRVAELPGAGSFVVQGLPEATDRSNVRVRCEGGDVVGVEVRDRVVDRVPSARVQELRDKLQSLQREAKVLEDGLAVVQAMRQHLDQLSKIGSAEQGRDVQSGKPSVEAWGASFKFVFERLAESVAAAREAQWKIEAKGKEIEQVQAELGRSQGVGSVALHDVVVEVVAPGKSTLDVEYLVARTGWQPSYDLRASRELDKVELTYRARVWQRTGEDWDDVELVLSTARPQIGAQGPEPQPVWVDVLRPMADAKGRDYAGAALDDLKSSRKVAAAEAPSAPEPRPFASVETQGLSVHFKLAKRQTVQSRDEPTTVLVGTGDLSIAAERACVPALDTTVWLRAKAKNTSPWVLLPGSAAVFFGADYLGQAQIATVQTGEELTLHLGADPGISVTRTQVQDLSKGPGFLSTKSSRIEGWRIHLVNHGAVGAGKDGSADVIVREACPRSRDDRISVEISKSEPKVSEDERWKADREEKGIQTWVVKVPKGEKGIDVLFETTISYPKGLQIAKE